MFSRNGTNEMVSRRRILSRSRDDLNLEAAYQEEEDDVWYKKEKLYSVSMLLCSHGRAPPTGQSGGNSCVADNGHGVCVGWDHGDGFGLCALRSSVIGPL